MGNITHSSVGNTMGDITYIGNSKVDKTHLMVRSRNGDITNISVGNSKGDITHFSDLKLQCYVITMGKW